MLPPDYATAFAEIKGRIRKECLRVVLAANAGLVLLYWDIGRAILDRQDREGWGAKVIDRLSQDLRDAFPDMRGCRRATWGICGPSPPLGRTAELCKRCLHNHLVPLHRSTGQGQGLGNPPLVRPEGA